jgi:hypothetical protein
MDQAVGFLLRFPLQSSLAIFVVTVFGQGESPARRWPAEHGDARGRPFPSWRRVHGLTVPPLPSDAGETLGPVAGPGDDDTMLSLSS